MNTEITRKAHKPKTLMYKDLLGKIESAEKKIQFSLTFFIKEAKMIKKSLKNIEVKIEVKLT